MRKCIYLYVSEQYFSFIRCILVDKKQFQKQDRKVFDMMSDYNKIQIKSVSCEYMNKIQKYCKIIYEYD